MAKAQGNIIALGFDSLDGAENMLANVHLWQDKGFFTVKDAVVVTKGSGNNQLEIKQTVKKAGKWALGGGGIGFLAGMLLGGPVGGLIVGATVGAISGALKDSGIDDNFIHVVGSSLRGDTSALLVMVEPNPNRNEEELLNELREQRATVLSTSLAPEREQQLRSLLSGNATSAPKRAPDPAVAPSVQPAATDTAANSEAMPEAGTETSMEASPESEAEVVPEAAIETIPEPAIEASTEVSPDATIRE